MDFCTAVELGSLFLEGSVCVCVCGLRTEEGGWMSLGIWR